MTQPFAPATLLPELLNDRSDLLVRLINLLDRTQWNGAQETKTIRGPGFVAIWYRSYVYCRKWA